MADEWPYVEGGGNRVTRKGFRVNDVQRREGDLEAFVSQRSPYPAVGLGASGAVKRRRR